MLNFAKKTVSVLAHFFIVTGAIFLMSLAVSNKAYAKQGFDNPNQVCTDTVNLQSVKDAAAVLSNSRFRIKFLQPCQWKTTTIPNVIAPAEWRFRNYTEHDDFSQGSPLFNSVLDLMNACLKSGGRWGEDQYGNPQGTTSYVFCRYYPKR